MNNKKFALIALVLVAIVQIYVPAKMIIAREKVLNTGIDYKFRTAPIDPLDPFRGKYINLDFEENMVDVQGDNSWEANEPVFVILTTDSNGFAKVKSASRLTPAKDTDFVEAKVRNVIRSDTYRLIIEFPFSRFYMEESKAFDAEKAYRGSLSDSTLVTYALVKIKNGEAVLTDVFINDISIEDIVMNDQNNRK